MQSKILDSSDGRRTYAVVLETGDEVMSCLGRFLTNEKISAAQITAIGALSDVVLTHFDIDVVLTHFDIDEKRYIEIPVREQVEVASMIGDVALDPDGKPALHIHLVVGKRNGTALAGHLGQGHVRPTLEVTVNESPAHLQKVHDPETGLALIRPTERVRS
ncbi:PPC domain-containing DNA-binding protein [Bradyrhizobium icense]|uniref:PPC domain-containing protein n=1 Tax=Bradyrhizobium icense TaxID=1274631 RepID=A0A1B1UDR3_9BRAD|nr:PPC domain-containing DNA-binding protein [Bradyrhizobium icense]ANW00885.1 hypothetical protein LMTR13_12575 [Bradyrhizobium icense]